MEDELPIEIVDVIYKMVHRMSMKEVIRELKDCVVFVLAKEGLSFWVCSFHNNPFNILTDDCEWEKLSFHHKKKDGTLIKTKYKTKESANHM